jgi:RNA polymerase sigma factor (sigma-70 family)
MSVHSEQEAESHPLFLSSPVWKTAYRKYHRFWLNLARGQQLSEDEAKDLLHSILYAIMVDDQKEFLSIEHVRNYVARSILNRSVIVRKEAGRKLAWNEALENLNPVLNDAESDGDTLRDGIREGMMRLSSVAFRIIKLRFYAGLTLHQVSELLNMPVSTVKSREEAAIKKIRASLRKKGF